MSLAEIQGTPLGTKMGITPTVTTGIVKSGLPSYANYPSRQVTNIPILTKTGVQPIGVKTIQYGPGTVTETITIPTKTTTTIAPPPAQGVVGEVAKQTVFDTIGGALENALRGIVIPTKGYNVTSSPLGSLGQLMVNVSGTKPVTVVEPKTSTTVNISQNPLMAVVKSQAEENLGAWYMQNPAVQKMLAVARTGMTLNALNKAGWGNVYLPGSDIPVSQQIAPTIYNKEVGDVSKIAAYKWQTAQEINQPLAAGTVQGIVAKEYLQNTTTIYERIIERFTEYINQGGGGTPTPTDKGTDWGLIAIIGIVAIAGVLLLGSFIKRS